MKHHNDSKDDKRKLKFSWEKGLEPQRVCFYYIDLDTEVEQSTLKKEMSPLEVMFSSGNFLIIVLSPTGWKTQNL
jgi:hypothetical protein